MTQPYNITNYSVAGAGNQSWRQAPGSKNEFYIASNISTRCLVLPCRICLSVLYLSRPCATLPWWIMSFFVCCVLLDFNSSLSVCNVKRTIINWMLLILKTQVIMNYILLYNNCQERNASFHTNIPDNLTLAYSNIPDNSHNRMLPHGLHWPWYMANSHSA